jgi:hypothetical protein
MRLSEVRIGHRDMKSRETKNKDMKSRELPTSTLLTVILQQIASCGLRGISQIIHREAQKALTTCTSNSSIV